MKIIKNPDENIYEKITQAVKDNEGFCPCKIQKNMDTKCLCKEFRETKELGECHCGRYIKVEA